ncbi:unnamed protein product [Auanema sp. JU1783]|nr:unnamed protein product [Auanema sp. JU1783]
MKSGNAHTPGIIHMLTHMEQCSDIITPNGEDAAMEAPPVAAAAATVPIEPRTIAAPQATKQPPQRNPMASTS